MLWSRRHHQTTSSAGVHVLSFRKLQLVSCVEGANLVWSQFYSKDFFIEEMVHRLKRNNNKFKKQVSPISQSFWVWCLTLETRQKMHRLGSNLLTQSPSSLFASLGWCSESDLPIELLVRNYPLIGLEQPSTPDSNFGSLSFKLAVAQQSWQNLAQRVL